LGDIICTIPAALEIKKLHPDATFIYKLRRQLCLLPKMVG